MSRLVTFVDTSILLEVLAVPGKSQQPENVRTELRERTETGETLILPTAAIIETGNHIAQLDGRARRDRAAALTRVLRATYEGTAPWTLNGAVWDASLLRAICDGARGCLPLAEMAAQGVGAGDVSILAEAEAYEHRVARVAVGIWTLDAGLAAYG